MRLVWRPREKSCLLGKNFDSFPFTAVPPARGDLLPLFAILIDPDADVSFVDSH